MSEILRAASIWWIPGCPLLAAVLIALFGKALLRGGSHRLTIAALAVSSVLALGHLWNVAATAHHPAAAGEHQVARTQADAGAIPVGTGFEWVSIGGLHVHADVEIDALSAVMLAMVTCVSLLVAVYAGGYMHGDAGFPRFFAELSLFVFSMCMLVMAKNFVVLFVFWEAVGLCSYLLIGFWFDRPSAAAAARKAFVVNRIGDAAFLIGLFLIWRTFGTLDYAGVFGGAASHAASAEYSNRIFQICLCLFIGACGKSAQFPLHLWLPDAMEGPTPVSALIHAATMVTAGVYMVARCTPLFVLAPLAQAIVAAIGGITALLAALIALTQTDLKRVLAYSTVSQLGYMFMALGSAAAGGGIATAAVTAAVFHMFTHAFFKALLFLSSGNVMHAMGHVIDMRQFGGLKKIMPVTNIAFLCGAAALAGFPMLSGFWSKDEILGLLWNATHHGEFQTLFQGIFAMAVVTAVLTAFYSFRAYFMTFHGPTRIPDEAYAHAHDPSQIQEGSLAMKWPLVVLAVFAIGVGLAVGPTHRFSGWIEQTPGLAAGEAHALDWRLATASGLAAIFGIGLAAAMYGRDSKLATRIRRSAGPFYKLSLNKFYLDEIAAILVAFPVNALAFLSLVADQALVDRLVDGVGGLPSALGRFLRPVQNGLIQSYALVMFFGLAILLTTITMLQLSLAPIP